jgi:hypothetical protein
MIPTAPAQRLAGSRAAPGDDGFAEPSRRGDARSWGGEREQADHPAGGGARPSEALTVGTLAAHEGTCSSLSACAIAQAARLAMIWA